MGYLVVGRYLSTFLHYPKLDDLLAFDLRPMLNRVSGKGPYMLLWWFLIDWNILKENEDGVVCGACSCQGAFISVKIVHCPIYWAGCFRKRYSAAVMIRSAKSTSILLTVL